MAAVSNNPTKLSISDGTNTGTWNYVRNLTNGTTTITNPQLSDTPNANDIVYIVEHNSGQVSVLTLEGERLAQWSILRSAPATVSGAIRTAICTWCVRDRGDGAGVSSNTCG